MKTLTVIVDVFVRLATGGRRRIENGSLPSTAHNDEPMALLLCLSNASDIYIDGIFSVEQKTRVPEPNVLIPVSSARWPAALVSERIGLVDTLSAHILVNVI